MTRFDVSAGMALPLTQEQHSALPGRKEDSDFRGQAWQREMERAQMEAWLSHGVIGRTTSAGAGLMPSSVAAGAASAAVSSQAEAITARVTPSKPLSASPSAASVHSAQAAVPGVDVTPSGHARGMMARANSKATPSDVPTDRKRLSLHAVASSRAANIAAYHAPLPPPALTVAATTVPTEPRSSLAQRQSVLPQAPSATVRGSLALPPNFNAARLTQVLRRFGAIEVTTALAPVAKGSWAPSVPEAENPHGLSRAAQVLAVAATPAEPPRGLSFTSGLIADSSLQPQALAARTMSPADRLAKMPVAPAAEVASEPIRVHADWSEDGVRVWLGMDAGALDSLEQVTVQLQSWLNAQGLRLRSLSCNGQVLREESPSHDSSSDDGLVSGERPVFTPYFIPKEFP